MGFTCLAVPANGRLEPMCARGQAGIGRHPRLSRQLVPQACPGRPPARRALLCSASAGAAAAAASAVPATLLPPELAFTAATYFIVPVYGLMLLAPRARLTRAVVDSSALPLLFSCAYALLAVQAGQAGLLASVVEAVRGFSAAPDLAALASLFQQPMLTSLAWLHLLLLDFLQARAVLRDGLERLVPTAHSVALCFMFGPLGLVSHLATKWLLGGRRGIAATQGL